MKILDVFCNLLCAMLCLLLCGCANRSSANSNKSIKIGIITSLTGAADEEGRSWLEGVQLASDELKEQGLDLSLVIDDDETKASKMVSAFAKMAAVDKVSAIIGGTWDFLGEAAYPLAKQYRIPFLSPTNPVEILSSGVKDNPYVYVCGLSLAAEREALRSFLVKEQVRSISILESTIPWGTFHADMVQSLASELGITVKARIPFSFDSYPEILKSLALQLSRDTPDLVFAPIAYSGIDVLLREFARLKISTKLMTTQHLGDAFKLSNDPALYVQAYAIYPKLSDPTFFDRFFKKFNHPPTVYAPHGYDALIFMVQALNAGVKFGDINATFEYNGATGPLKLSNSTRALGLGSGKIMTTRNGKFEEWQ